MKTRITEMLGITFPIIQGGMQYVSYPELAAAVSNSGGMGTINATLYSSGEEFKDAIRKMKSLTDKPFCVNMSLLPDVKVGDELRYYIHICAMEEVKVIETAGTKPNKLTPLIHDAGILHIHKVPATRYGLSAEKCGVDAVTAVGYECGGHPGMDGIGTMVLANEASRSLKIPVIAGGGIVDGRGIVAALALGAEAVIMGTRFLASQEAPVSENHKQWLLEATEKSTVLIQKSIRNMMRAADNQAARECLRLEEKGASLEELMTVISGKRGRDAYASGWVDSGIFPVGTGCSLIKEIKPVEDIMRELVQEMEETTERLGKILPL